MKKSIFYLAMTLVVFVTISNVSYDTKKEVKASKEKSFETSTNDSQTVSLSEINFFEQKKFPIATVSNVLKSKTAISVDFIKPLIDYSFEDIETVRNTTSKSIEEIITEDNAITENNFSNETKALDFEIINANLIYSEGIESVVVNKIEKTIEEVIAQDNAITENNFSNATQALDFDIINAYLLYNEAIESVVVNKIEKTIEEVIAQDNAITENNFSNATQELDFEIINRSSIREK